MVDETCSVIDTQKVTYEANLELAIRFLLWEAARILPALPVWSNESARSSWRCARLVEGKE
jgi:hypothetical protein